MIGSYKDGHVPSGCAGHQHGAHPVPRGGKPVGIGRRHRDRLRQAGPDVRLVHLAGSPDLARRRIEGRDGHFMAADLVESQFAALEPPEGEAGVLRLDPARPVEELVEAAADWAEMR